LVSRFHGDDAASRAEQEFDRVHVEHRAPTDVPEVRWPPPSGGGRTDGSQTVHLPALLAHAFGVSTSEARRALTQGGVRLDGDPIPSSTLDLEPERVDGRMLQLGKRRFARVRVR
jgi:tyrosyl-tRNA synthetase